MRLSEPPTARHWCFFTVTLLYRSVSSLSRKILPKSSGSGATVMVGLYVLPLMANAPRATTCWLTTLSDCPVRGGREVVCDDRELRYLGDGGGGSSKNSHHTGVIGIDLDHVVEVWRFLILSCAGTRSFVTHVRGAGFWRDDSVETEGDARGVGDGDVTEVLALDGHGPEVDRRDRERRIDAASP